MPYPTSSQTSIGVYNNDIVWNFSSPQTVGRYWNDDPFVVTGGTVSIASVTPASQQSGGRWINGMMNGWTVESEGAGGSIPGAGTGSVFAQGWDGAAIDQPYQSGLNIDPGNTGSATVITGEATLIKAISLVPPPGDLRPVLSDLGYLNVVSAVPAQDSFRPSPYRAAKADSFATRHTLGDVDLDRIPSFAATDSAPAYSLNNIERQHLFGQLNYDHVRHLGPSNHMRNYGADNGEAISNAALLMCSDAVTAQEKANLAYYLVQMGLDIADRLAIGGVWWANGGLAQGYKLPLVIAATLLQDRDIIDLCDGTVLNQAPARNMSDDQQMFVVEAGDVGRVVSFDNVTYKAVDLGMPEWGEKHQQQGGTRDGRQWGSPSRFDGEYGAYYRQINMRWQVGAALAARMIGGAYEVWNWNPFFCM